MDNAIVDLRISAIFTFVSSGTPTWRPCEPVRWLQY